MKLDKLQMYKAGASLLITSAMALNIVGCSSEKQSAEITSNSVGIVQVEDSPKEESIIIKNIEDADSSVEAAIGIMLDSAETLAESSERAKETESYQKAKEEALQNFDTLFKFLLGQKEIEGYTITDVKESTIETATDALFTLDEYIEKYIPDYKDKAKEKLNQLKNYMTSDEVVEKLAQGYNKIQDYKDEFIDYKDRIKESAEKSR